MKIRALLTLPCGLFATLPALAHEGHGMPGSSHWHATDTSLLLFAVVAAAVLWLAGRK